MAFREHHSTMITKIKTQKPNGNSGRAQPAMTIWLGHFLGFSEGCYLFVPRLGMSRTTEKAGINLVADEKEGQDLDI